MVFKVNVFHYVNEREKVNYELNFVKNKVGSCRFDGYRATLYNELKPNETLSIILKSISLMVSI